MTNVARHAAAKHVTITLKSINGKLRLNVVDDGSGFERQILKDGEGLGVAFMRERASLVDGDLEVASSPEQGTTVIFTAPL